MNEGLINAVIEQIVIDVEAGDLTYKHVTGMSAIGKLLTYVPEEILVGFLSGMQGEWNEDK
jgi:hypothetical protein